MKSPMSAFIPRFLIELIKILYPEVRVNFKLRFWKTVEECFVELLQILNPIIKVLII